MIDTKEQIEIWQGCTHCKNKSTNPNEYPCEECFAFNKYEPMTNADRIRNMTDDELASFLIAMQISTKVRNRVDSKKEIDEYLQAEVKEGNSNENT